MIAQGERVVPGTLLASDSQGMSEGEGCYTNDRGEIRSTLNGVVKHEAIVIGEQGSEEEENAAQKSRFINVLFSQCLSFENEI